MIIGSYSNILFSHCLNSDLKNIQNYFNQGGDLMVRDDYGRTALHYAVIRDNTSIIRYLLDRGLILDQCDYFSQTALIYSLTYSSYASLGVLLEYGANVNHKDILGNSPLHYAVKSYRKSIIFLLVKYGADFSAKNSRNISPLDHLILNSDWIFFSHYVNQIFQGWKNNLKLMSNKINSCNNKELIRKFKSILNEDKQYEILANNHIEENYQTKFFTERFFKHMSLMMNGFLRKICNSMKSFRVLIIYHRIN